MVRSGFDFFWISVDTLIKEISTYICCSNRRVYARKCSAFFDIFENEMEEIKMFPRLSAQCPVKQRN
jgi:hypothetical protein